MYTYKNKTEMERKLKIVIILFQPLNFNLSYYFQIKKNDISYEIIK